MKAKEYCEALTTLQEEFRTYITRSGNLRAEAEQYRQQQTEICEELTFTTDPAKVEKLSKQYREVGQKLTSIELMQKLDPRKVLRQRYLDLDGEESEAADEFSKFKADAFEKIKQINSDALKAANEIRAEIQRHPYTKARGIKSSLRDSIIAQ